MKNLDTQTVMEIIRMLDVAMEKTSKASQESATATGEIDLYLVGKYDSLAQIADHLQSYIEGQLNAEELRTGE